MVDLCSHTVQSCKSPRRPERAALSERKQSAPRSRPLVTGSPELLELVMMRLRVICEPTRVQIMALLDQEGSVTVQQLAGRLPSSQQNISKHLQTLYGVGMVMRRKDGNHVYYELADWSALWLVEQVASTVAAHLELQHQLVLGQLDPPT
jgi:DNA-binding transcriptional ArsR family regulator